MKKKFDLMSRDQKIGLMFDLINAFKDVKTPYKSALLLNDLLTANEIRNIAFRLRIAKMLLNGDLYKDISKKLKTSSATITKVKVWLDEGGDNLERIVKKLPKKYSIPKDLPPIPIEFHLPQVLLTVAQYSEAKKQDALVEGFGEKAKKKEDINRGIQKMFDEQYVKMKTSKQ